MARSRNIKPSFFLNDQLADCDPLARIMFAGLWCIADREGRLKYRPRKIRAEILPYDNCDAVELLNQLKKAQFIEIYEIQRIEYIQILKFTDHQQPHYKETASVIPPMSNWEDSGTTPGYVPKKIRDKILDRDKVCQNCSTSEKLSIDHIIPRSLGGSHEENNLQILCQSCNSSKNNKLQHQSNVNPTSTQHQPNGSSTESLDVSPLTLTLNPLTLTLNPLTDTLNLNIPKENYNAEFNDWWKIYPCKTAKPKAKKKFIAIMKIGKVTATQIMIGTERYMQHLSEATWKRPQGPEAWLNGERWADEFPSEPKGVSGGKSDLSKAFDDLKDEINERN